MKLPSVPVITLPGGFRWEQHDVPLRVWQAHLLKHPLGIRAARLSPPRPWNDEGWDQLAPPAITSEERAKLVADIPSLAFSSQRCGVEELHGRASEAPQPECYACDPPLLLSCRDRLAKSSLPHRYAAEAERLVRAVADGERMVRGVLTRRLIKALASADIWDGLVLMSVGRVDGQPVVRVSSADGGRVDLYLEAGARLRWKTVYRQQVQSRPQDRFRFVTEGAPRDARISLSEDFVVARDWVNRHGT